jgi:hypothetical protein
VEENFCWENVKFYLLETVWWNGSKKLGFLCSNRNLFCLRDWKHANTTKSNFLWDCRQVSGHLQFCLWLGKREGAPILLSI